MDYDAVSSLSFSSLFSAAGLGATAFFQNDLATANGSIAYRASRDAAKKTWGHLLDLRFNYSGLYPQFETTLKVSNGTPSHYQFLHLTQTTGKTAETVTARQLSGPAVSFSARVYVPLVFSSGGWNRGLVPQVRYSLSNSVFDGTVFTGERFGLFPEKDKSLVLTGMEVGPTVFLQNVTASLRGYVMRPTAASGVYPRWGIGAEAGAGFRPSLTRIYDPAVYGYLYGYLPGWLPEHGLKLTALAQRFWTGGATRRLGDTGEGAYIAEMRVNTYPRGYTASASTLGRYLATHYPSHAKWTADYLMAVLPVDWSGLGPVAYVKNFELGLHADAALYVPPTSSTAERAGSAKNARAAMLQHGGTSNSAENRDRCGALMSAGASLSVRLGNLLWVPFDTRIGATWSCNFGPSFDAIRAAGVSLDRHYVGLLFSVDY